MQINDADDSPLSPIVTQLRHVTKKGETVKINPFPLSIFDLDTEDMFITYEGSLTTPPCSETVTWLLTQNYRYVTNEQVFIILSFVIKIIYFYLENLYSYILFN